MQNAINTIRNHIVHDRRGGTMILMTLLILFSIVTVSLVAAETMRLGLMASRIQADATKAFYAAESGAERVLWDIRQKVPPIDLETGDCSDNNGHQQYKFCFSNDTLGDFVECKKDNQNCDPSATYERQTIPSGNSYYIIWATSTPVSADKVTIKSRGFHADTRRVVEISF